MKVFNKDKALRQIKLKQNKNTYIKKVSIVLSCFLLLVGIMYFTFAKFEQNSEEYTLINGKVKYGDNGDLDIAVKINGSSVTDFPENNGNYVLSGIDCSDKNGKVNLEYDERTWTITKLQLTSKTKCVYSFVAKEEWTFDYLVDSNNIGTYQEFIAPKNGNYEIELWGAEGGNYNSTYHSGHGAYVKGNIVLNKNQKVFIVVGEKGPDVPLTNHLGGFNGGGGIHSNAYSCTSGGGGSTDIRIVEPTFELSNTYHTYVSSGESLNSRIMVAAGAGGGASGCQSGSAPGADAGGLTGYNADGYNSNYSYGGTQISGGNGYYHSSGNATQYVNGIFGIGGSAGYYPWGGGGAGYYGGGSGGGYQGGGAGGSSYISGHTGCVAITSSSDQTPKSGCTTGTTDIECSKHYSGLYFTSTKMIDGAGYEWTTEKASTSTGMPTHDGTSTMTGNSGNGYAKITYLGE